MSGDRFEDLIYTIVPLTIFFLILVGLTYLDWIFSITYTGEYFWVAFILILAAIILFDAYIYKRVREFMGKE